MEKFLLGCDWGTSSFRLRLYDRVRQSVIGEVVSDEGIGVLHRNWEDNRQHQVVHKAEMFRNYLQQEINVLSCNLSLTLEQVPVVVSGMASSSIGLEDIPYAPVPFALDGSAAIIKRFEAVEHFQHEIILISGVRTGDDVMRGEETQLIGLFDLLKQSGKMPDKGMLILPGTHSKHVYINNGQLVNFNTFMTGELFNIISRHSILKDSVSNGEINQSDAMVGAFKAGLQQSVATGILNGLFTVRTNQLFGKSDPKQNSSYLSGLLIGEELHYLSKEKDLPLFLCSGQNLFGFYKWAFEELQLLYRTTLVPFDLVDQAAVAGQNLIFNKHIVNGLK